MFIAFVLSSFPHSLYHLLRIVLVCMGILVSCLRMLYVKPDETQIRDAYVQGCLIIAMWLFLLWNPAYLNWLVCTLMRIMIVVYGMIGYAQFNNSSPLLLAAINKHWNVVEYFLTDEYHFDVNAVYQVSLFIFGITIVNSFSTELHIIRICYKG